MSASPALFDIKLSLPLESFVMDLEYKGNHRVLGVFGVSGSGKTTLLECIAGLRKGSSGRVAVSDETWLDADRNSHRKAKERRVGYVPQDSLLFPHLNVRGNLEAGRARAVASGIDFEATLKSVVSALELDPLLDRPIGQLSGGERQRVSLGRALCSGPKLLLLDEPLASLDLSLRKKILPFLIRIKENFDIPMIVVSHNPIELQVLCDEVLFLEKGRCVKVGSPNELFASASLFDVAKAQGFENVFSGAIMEKLGPVDRMGSAVGDTSICIQITATDQSIGEQVVASIGSDNILIGLDEPRGLSARNCLPAIVKRIEETESRWLAHTAVSGTDWNFVVELTRDAIEALSLKADSDVYLIFKTSSVSTLS